MHHLLQDVLFAIRKFQKTPGVILAAILTLALGIGVNTAMFSIIDGICLRPLDISDPEHLLLLKNIKKVAATNAEKGQVNFSYAEYTDLKKMVPAFSTLMAVDRRGAILKTADNSRQSLLINVNSDNYFTGMGLHAEIGRLPTEEELSKTKTPVVVLGYRTWKQIFAGDPSIVGKAIELNGQPATVLGVMSANFQGTERFLDPQLYVPISTWVMWSPGEGAPNRNYRDYEVFARLAPGATLDQAQAQLDAANKNLASAYPATNAGRNYFAGWERSENTGLKIYSALLLALSGAILLICCANIANLLMALNESRRREIAMRMAIGATRMRLIRQMLTEYAALAIAGVLLAFLMAEQAIALVPALIPQMGIPFFLDLRLDHRVMLFSLCLATLSILFFGLGPAVFTTKSSPLDALRTNTAVGSGLRIPIRKLSVLAQVTISMTFLVGAGLLVRTLVHLQTMDIGFNRTQNAALLQIMVDCDNKALMTKFDSIREKMRALPGATGATISRVDPFPTSGGGATYSVLAPNEAVSKTAGIKIRYNLIDHDYFSILGIELLRGRNFGNQDSATSPRVVIVNQTLAKRFFGKTDIVGQHIRLNDEPVIDLEIIGVTQDGQYSDLAESPQPYLFLPQNQAPAWHEVTLTIATAQDPHPLLLTAKKILQSDASIFVEESQTFKDRMDFATYPNRMIAYLVLSLGALALVLTSVGLFGVVSYIISKKTHDLGICIALGADRINVLRTVLKEALPMIFGGIGLGLLLSSGAAHALHAALYGVQAIDPLVLLISTGVLVVVAFSALVTPVRRALQIDPVEALREE